MSEWTGRLLGKVQLGPLIARGGMAEVYLGTHTTLQREVAVKILRNQYEDDPELLERFQREARVVAKLRHQNVVQVFDYDTVDDHPYIVMEYVPGPSLSRYLSSLHKQQKRLELPEIARILTGVANALQYAHDRGVIHRDIKPGNILLTSHSTETEPNKPLPHDFQPVLTDFGLVRFLNSARQTSAGQTAGTPAYMSPEQARGEVTDGRTDIYSLGIVLYEMLTGKVPFDGETTVSILMKHITDPPPPIPGLPVNLQKVLTKALAKNRDARFQKPVEFATAFNAAVNAEKDPSTFMGLIAVSEPESVVFAEPVDSRLVVEPPKSPVQRRWMPVALGATALLGLTSALFLLNGSASNIPPTETSVPPTHTIVAPTLTATEKPIIGLTGASNAVAVLHFKDENAVMDQAWLELIALPEPPAGRQYEAFLVGADARVSLGNPVPDEDGKGELLFSAAESDNLLALYDQIEIVLVPTDAESEETESLAYTYALPEVATQDLRLLLVGALEDPNQTALVQSLLTDSTLIEAAARDLRNALTAGDPVSVRKHAETILNILAGRQSADYKDWNDDGSVSNQGSGLGFLSVADNPGHLRAISISADKISEAPDATQNMIYYGGRIQACIDNLNLWVPELQGELQNVLGADSLEATRGSADRALSLVEKIDNGLDVNQNGIVEPIAGECGVVTLYAAAYDLADMPLFAVDITATPTHSGSGPLATPTRASGDGGAGGGGGNSGPTQHVPPGQDRPDNPNKPENPGGGNGGGQGNNP